ncbi:hypothetical protein WN944_019387 [Citrus x changshan-huyou]|uniref:Uncharacterized protein n=1 Tax=Citrus x changshan-huyou TaxID=2935761 RepID=A0AAP0LV57_9ROSI
MEFKEDLKKAFYKDMAEKNRSGLSSSSPKEGVKCKGRKREERLEVEPAVAGNHTPTLKSVYGQYFGY